MDGDDTEEIVEKQPSRAKKPPSTTSRTRVSARSKSALKDVLETEEEGQPVEDPPPPVKRRRGATKEGSIAVSDGTTQHELPPRKGRTTASSKASTSASRARSSVAVKEEGDEVEEVPAPTRRSARSSVPPKLEPSSTAVPSEKSKKRSARSGRKQVIVSDDDSDIVEISAIEAASSGSKARPSVPEKSNPRAGPSKPPARQKTPSPASQPESEPEPESTHDHPLGAQSDEPPLATPKISPRKAAPPPVESDEEPSMEQPPAPIPPTQPPLPAPEEPEGPQARLVIHKMALVNFKSYAGRQEIGPFHKSFSAIVGPNGSGKSNTIDALLFVFGYRASKMRQGKLSELIHNSDRYPDLQQCSVEIHFREIIDLPGPDAFEVVPGSKLVVARTAYKSNKSEYSVNGRTSSYKEVQALLKGKDIDLDHNRFLILQGEVEAIALMKPKAPSEHEDGLLEYLEDIIGTSKFKQPLEEAYAEVERLTDERVEKYNRLRITEKEKNALEDKKREAEDYLRLKNEYTKALSRYQQFNLWRCLDIEKEFNKNIARASKDLKDLQAGNAGDVSLNDTLQADYEEREKTYKQLKAMVAEVSKDLAKEEKRQVSLEEKVKHAKTKTKKLKKTVSEEEHSLAEAERSIEENDAKAEREAKKVQDHEKALAKEEKALEEIQESLKDKTRSFHDKIEVKQKELQPWTIKFNEKRAAMDLAKSERETIAKKFEVVREAKEEAESTKSRLQGEKEAKEVELRDLRQRKAGMDGELDKLRQHSQHAQEGIQKCRQKASATRQKVEEARASQAASTSQNRVLDSLTQLRRTGRINGFHGRLGNLGTIPEKYDVAVTTAASALNNLVVDTVEQAQACIEHLRKNNIGRASFMILEKLSRVPPKPAQTPENTPRLFDLITPKEPKFAPALYKAVQDTLVAQDLTQAKRIAYKERRKVVTIAGDLIEAFGTMSGGGKQVARGGMNSKFTPEVVSPEVLRNYQQESDGAEAKFREAQERHRSIEAELEALIRSGPEIDLSLQKASMDVQNITKAIAESERRLRELSSKNQISASDKSRISALDSTIETATGELEEIRSRAKSIEDEIKTLEKKILDIGGARLLTQKSKVDGLKLHINIANDEITKAEVAKAKAEKDVAKLRKNIQNNTDALSEAEADLEELDREMAECAQAVKDIKDNVEDAKAKEENSKADLDEVKSRLDELSEKIRGFKKQELALTQKLQKLEAEAQDNQVRMEHWSIEHDKLRLEDVDSDDDDEEEEEGEEGEGDVQKEGEVKPEVKSEPGVSKKKAKEPNELHIYGEDELKLFKLNQLTADVQLLDEKLQKAKPNLGVLKEYRKREEEWLKRAQDAEDTTKQRDAQKQRYDQLRKQRLDEFMAGFTAISFKLKEMYQMITLGGNAELELVDSMDPFSEGIIFSVMPPKKSWRNISNLSGGEKTLSSLALVFALHAYKPTPLYFMDEIDAALDFRNVSIVANYIKDRTKNAQFIIISLRNDMFEVSHRLIGIYKVANATKSVSIDNFALNAPAPPQAPALGFQACPPPSAMKPASSIKFASSVKPRSTSVRA